MMEQGINNSFHFLKEEINTDPMYMFYCQVPSCEEVGLWEIIKVHTKSNVGICSLVTCDEHTNVFFY